MGGGSVGVADGRCASVGNAWSTEKSGADSGGSV